jgi:hypothetical protein
MKLPSVSTIVLSYNRPNMLREALSSIRGADQIIVTDDGSDFGIHALLAEFELPNVVTITNPPMTLEERLVTPRLGKLINRALKAVTCDIVTYLCDDDLFSSEWIPAVKAFFAENKAHTVQGIWMAFRDGEPLETAVPIGDDENYRKLEPCRFNSPDITTGNFAHRAICRATCNARWSETVTAVHDFYFLYHMLGRAHPPQKYPRIPVVAGYRRVHKYNMLPFTQMKDYLPEAREVLKGMLEDR